MLTRHVPPRRRGLLAVALVGAVVLAGCARPVDGSVGAPATGTPVVTSAAALPSTATSTVSPLTASPATAPMSVLSQTPQGAPAAPLGECTADTVRTRTAGVLTVATGADPSAPWFVGPPGEGQGLEAAVASAVARGLGFDAASTRWVQADRTDVLAGRVDTFDLDLDRFSAAELADAPVDVSSGYFSDADAVLVPAGEPAPATLAALAATRLVEVAAADGTTVNVRSGGVVAAAGTVSDTGSATAALRDGSADGVVLTLTAALAASAADPGVRVLGRLPSDSTQPDQLVAVLAPGSGLTPCVSAVLDRLRVEGTLDELARTWVPVPVLG